jgi:non-specific serine/threonine protein kinase
MVPPDAEEDGITPELPQNPRRLRAVEPAEAERAPRSPERPRHNLPVELSSFVGREEELPEVRRLLENNRLLTLAGPGGCGKTRLALAAASELVERFEGGVWLVDLAPLAEPSLLPQAVASTMGVREQPGRSLTETLSDHLRTKKLLLVLDNCEHLIEACAELAEALLRSCPELKVLATSREALGVSGERAWVVPSLSVPDPERLRPIEELGSYEAIRLFCERTKATSSFELTEENVLAVAQLCRRLDGVPLAIELAAARTKVLSVGQILRRLKDSLKLLAGTERTAPTRQRTLRDTLDWSYELMSEPERKLFGRLSVFAGGWTLETVEEVGAGEAIEEGEVLDLLSGLVDKSMVVVGSVAEDALRFRMLEPVRQYAQERLEESGEAEQVRDRHARHFLALAERAEQELMGAQQETWLKLLETEHDNLRAALGWSLEGGGAELGLRLSGALGGFWHMRGHFSEGRRWLEKSLLRGSNSPNHVRAKAINEAGWIAVFQSDGRARVLLEEALSLRRELGDKEGVATSLATLGHAVLHRGDKERLEALCEEAEALRREPLEQRSLGHLLYFLALAALVGGEVEQSAVLAEEGLALNRELHDMRGVVLFLVLLGMIALQSGEHERAAALFGEDLHLSQRLGDKAGAAFCLLGLAGAASLGGRPARAARLWGALETLREAVGIVVTDMPLVRSWYDYEGRLAAARAQLDEVAWEAAWAEGRAMSLEQAVEYALEQQEPSPKETATPLEKVYPAGLSSREAEVLRLVATGLTNAGVAEELFLSSRTVEWYLGAIYRKLGIHSRAEATRFAAEHDLL